MTQGPAPGRLRGFLAALAIVLGVTAPVVAAPAPAACAAESHHAALVVDTGGHVYRYCVGFSDARVSGVQLIELAHDQYGLDYAFGYGGRGVCRLANVGSTSGCLAAGEQFWAYWRGDGSQGWSSSSLGAADTTVADGDVEGWSYGSGSSPTSHPPPPGTTLASVCEPEPAPSPSPSPGTQHSGEHGGRHTAHHHRGGHDQGAAEQPQGSRSSGTRGQGGSPAHASAPPSPPASPAPVVSAPASPPSSPRSHTRPAPRHQPRRAGNSPAHKQRGHRHRGFGSTPSPSTTSPQPRSQQAAATSKNGGGGPPAAGLGALGAALLLAGAGAAAVRRRARAGS